MDILCPRCHAPVGDEDQFCPCCRYDVGCPNVRIAESRTEIDALELREIDARSRLDKNGQVDIYDAFVQELVAHSGVVVSLPAHIAKNLLLDKRLVFQDYEKLVGAGVRAPAPSRLDHKRATVAGWLFGSNASRIIYGVLTLRGEGLGTYGDVHFRLREVTIESRTSFLERNSFAAAKEFGTEEPLPPGHRAAWSRRAQLAAVKISDGLRRGQGTEEWQALLVESNGRDRSVDEFIEAHIFDGFNAHSVESVATTDLNSLSREIRLDARATLELFKKHVAERSC